MVVECPDVPDVQPRAWAAPPEAAVVVRSAALMALLGQGSYESLNNADEPIYERLVPRNRLQEPVRLSKRIGGIGFQSVPKRASFDFRLPASDAHRALPCFSQLTFRKASHML